jgi:hypothetical protein
VDRDRQGQKGTDRNRKGQKGTDRGRHGQTGADRDRQGQTGTDRDRPTFAIDVRTGIVSAGQRGVNMFMCCVEEACSIDVSVSVSVSAVRLRRGDKFIVIKCYCLNWRILINKVMYATVKTPP